MLYSQKERSRDRAAAVHSLGREKARARNAESILLNMIRPRKGRTKELDQEVQLNETLPQKDHMPEKQGEVHLEKKNVLRVSIKKKEIIVMIESVIVGIPCIVNTSRKIHVTWERPCPFSHPHHKRTNDLPVLHEKSAK